MICNRTTIGNFMLALVACSSILLSSCASFEAAAETNGAVDLISTTPSRIAITIDDLPYVMPSKTSPADGLRYVQRINLALKKHGIIATGFVVGQQINKRSVPALQAFEPPPVCWRLQSKYGWSLWKKEQSKPVFN
jgi:predicted lipoprotein